MGFTGEGYFVVEFHGGFVYLPSQWMILRGRAVTLGHGKNLTLNWLSHTLCWFYWYKGCSHVGVFFCFLNVTTFGGITWNHLIYG